MRTTKEAFKRRLRGLIEDKEPFTAYWHPNGYGVMRLSPVTVSKRYLPFDTTGVYRLVEGDCKIKTSKNAPMTWKKNLMKMRKKYFTEVVTVDFDGEHIMTEGEIDL